MKNVSNNFQHIVKSTHDDSDDLVHRRCRHSRQTLPRSELNGHPRAGPSADCVSLHLALVLVLQALDTECVVVVEVVHPVHLNAAVGGLEAALYRGERYSNYEKYTAVVKGETEAHAYNQPLTNSVLPS